ncbi:mechanosensitive ion channel-like protein [Algoriphagus boseongensis]|uniref:Mechanosensitive ion channel-like protein n=2 Tax=Algoriphagus boseongensis TaxID=1442587 RepID=A0A4R6T558_9BACT|nr:mechanosensitive ion channel-like protein [Algoriphagus boseongensis]
MGYLDSLLISIRTDDYFKYKIRDSLLLPNYSLEINLLKKNIQSIDSTIFRQELQAARLQSRLNLSIIQIEELKDYVEKSKIALEKSIFKKEINFIWEDYSIPSPKSIFSITFESLELNWKLFLIQIGMQKISAIISALILLVTFYLVISTLKKLKKDENETNEGGVFSRIRFLKKNPIIGVILGLTPLLLLLFEISYFAFMTFSLAAQVILASIIIFRNYEKLIFLKWAVGVIVFLFFTVSNLYWEIAYQERMYYLIGNLLILAVLVGIKTKFKSELVEETRLITWVRNLTVLFLVLATVANILGRFSLSKILSIAGISSFAYAVVLYFFVKVLTEIIFLMIEKQKNVDYITAYLNFQEIQRRLRNILVIVAIFIWVALLLQNLSLNKYILGSLTEFMDQERKLGDSTFTFGSLFLFAGLVYLSSLIANNVSYFISLNDQNISSAPQKKLGSSVLIIRLGILTVGFFIAATAAKIPLDKIAIVLGALSVGIGFGLQTIINNLVSGLILAFEKPIQIGDDIEVGNMTGKVKEVGIRASKILAYDGSEIVVPNGDLLSQSLINWTLSNKRRRVELIIGVAYDSDMKKVKELISEVLKNDKIMKFPEPKVHMQNFGDSSVDFRVLFWVESMDIYLDVRNEVMNNIFESFLENGVEIPFPKRDLYIKSLPELKKSQQEENKKSPEE